eukprot:7702453-Alexandrium_andersonii.AAC.1
MAQRLPAQFLVGAGGCRHREPTVAAESVPPTSRASGRRRNAPGGGWLSDRKAAGPGIRTDRRVWSRRRPECPEH